MNCQHKQLFKTTLLLIGVLAISYIVVCYFLKSNFQKKTEQIAANSDKFFFGYLDLGEHFYNDKFRYPNNAKELYDFFASAPWFKEAKETMKDPFSKQNGDLLYVPVFSKTNRICEGYLLISAGIDGKINTQLPDSLYFETVKTLRFYNSLAPASSLSFRKYDLHFSFKDYLFGNKDLLIEYANGIAIFLNNACYRVYTPAKLMNKLHQTGFARLDCSVEGKVKNVGDSTVVITDDTCNVVCSMYKGRPFKIYENDSVKIAGCYRNKLDPKTKTIYLDHCIAVDR